MARIKFLSLFIVAPCKVQSVNIDKLSSAFNFTAKASSSHSRIQRFIGLFGQDCIDCLVADREFVGERWLEFLNEHQIRYFNY